MTQAHNQYAVTLLDEGALAAAQGKGEKLYEGDSYGEAEGAATSAFINPNNKGRTIRFCNFSLFGGGLKDTLIK